MNKQPIYSDVEIYEAECENKDYEIMIEANRRSTEEYNQLKRWIESKRCRLGHIDDNSNILEELIERLTQSNHRLQGLKPSNSVPIVDTPDKGTKLADTKLKKNKKGVGKI